MAALHQPVLLAEVLNALAVKPNQTVLDGTVGYGGHAQALLDSVNGSLTYIGLDRDADAVAAAQQRLKPYKGAHVLLGAYDQAKDLLATEGISSVDAILLDLGASSPQFDQPERGFSFQADGPLDMRFDIGSGEQTAADILNTYREQELVRIIRDYGEERYAVRIAKAIVALREASPFERTTQLRELIEDAIPRRLWPKRIHPATRTFQALRIETNRELERLTEALPMLVSLLKTGGRMAIISFHSLEDRIVKQFFRDQTRTCICPKEAPVCTCHTVPTLKILTKRPVQATAAEEKQNPRARSAKLRAAQKI
ncbi:MAG: 16S rRNA (cytosine(1402)-N(4))-methyltransferase RsmH [Parcubacteria group bacterium]|nr:16S rRNA (cytosine(1402)-N(4))-methyltransferase RsmH [Parcubacteria group bacterium]